MSEIGERMTRIETQFESLMAKMGDLVKSQEKTTATLDKMMLEAIDFRREFDSIVNKAWGFRVAFLLTIAFVSVVVAIINYFGMKLAVVMPDLLSK